MDKNIRREIILDNYQNPVNRGLTDDKDYIYQNTNSDSCIDNIDMQLKEEDGIIKDIVFDGEACAICTSATSILIKTLIGKTLEEAKTIINNYKNMINEKKYDEKLLGELIVYDEIYMQPNRKMCALLPSNAIEKILELIDNAADKNR